MRASRTGGTTHGDQRERSPEAPSHPRDDARLNPQSRAHMPRALRSPVAPSSDRWCARRRNDHTARHALGRIPAP